jgi:DNA methyltransferase 1-associated protein 1
MGDIANILGVQAKVALSASETAQAILAGPNPIPENKKKMKKPKGMSREVFDLMGPGGLVPAIESAKVGAGFKDKRVSVTKGKWLWAGFKNSARGDNCVLHHWQKADVQYADYPYAKFNIRSTPLTPLYTDEEYTLLLQSDDWTRSETDHLM